MKPTLVNPGKAFALIALAIGAVIVAFAAFLTNATAVAAPLFAQPQDVAVALAVMPDAGRVEQRSMHAPYWL